jgi:signal transduction histidine kinase
MHNESLFNRMDGLPSIVVNNDIVIEVSQGFLDMTEYYAEDLIDKNIREILKSLRIGPNFDIDNIDTRTDYFLFTKSLEVKFVNIELQQKLDNNLYIFSEGPNARINDRFHIANVLYSDNHYGIGIYSVAGFVLLKANEKYISFFDEPYNNKESSIGKNISEFIPDFNGSPFEEVWKSFLKTGKPYTIDECPYSRFGSIITYWRLTLIPVTEEDQIKYCVLMATEVTEQVLHRKMIEEQQELILKREEEKRQALLEAMDLKDEFLYLITHEFRTPMSVVDSALQLIHLVCKDEISERLARYLAMIKQNTNRQLRLVNNLLDITRISSGSIRVDRRRLDIVHVIKNIVDSVQIYAQQKNIKLDFYTTLSKKYVYTDEEKLERIMLNLISNALKFTPEGREINITLTTKKHKNKNVICINVEDEGIGIPEEKQKVIFERFGQVDSSLSRRAEGTGLGLHLVKLLVNALDGEIILKSEVNKGSTFTVMFLGSSREDLSKTAESDDVNSELAIHSDRVIQATSIEFSDIYF